MSRRDPLGRFRVVCRKIALFFEKLLERRFVEPGVDLAAAVFRHARLLDVGCLGVEHREVFPSRRLALLVRLDVRLRGEPPDPYPMI